jgi:predicted RNase H-like HicB family nuclease
MRKRPKIKIIIEKHKDCNVASPIGLKGVVVGQGDTYHEAFSDVRSAIGFHVETFRPNSIDGDDAVLEAFVADAELH